MSVVFAETLLVPYNLKLVGSTVNLKTELKSDVFLSPNSQDEWKLYVKETIVLEKLVLLLQKIILLLLKYPPFVTWKLACFKVFNIFSWMI